MSDEELKELIRQSGEETRRHFDVVADGLKHEIGTVGEAVVRLDEKVDHLDSSIREDTQRGFAETQAMIKFSYAELDRRLTIVEDDVATLRKRVSEIESKH
ncbi:MAG: hypothetical protein R3338_15185 [Thermoanaerobaculia bacterium]|nr:hypothetical protein [Thermoanaerobaculia bacterium]